MPKKITKITILGHLNQDTDATCSAIALENLFNKLKIFQATTKVASEINRETEYVLNYLKIKKPKPFKTDKIKNPIRAFLVDFNEEEQSPIPFSKLEIEGLVDHHKLKVKIEKDYPILFRVEPLGSSCSIIAKIYQDYSVALDKKTAGLLLAGILSDTLNFTSPTTTVEDKKIAKKLIEISKIDPKTFSQKMFEAKSNLEGIPAKKIITLDYKEFAFGKYQTGIGVLETVNPSSAFKMEQQIRRTLSNYKKERKLNLIYFGVVDILKKETRLFLVGKEEEEKVKKVFPQAKILDGFLYLPNVVSRKKQIVPEFMKKLK